MKRDNKYEYEITRRNIIHNGTKSNRFIFVRRKIGAERWNRVPDTPSFDLLGQAETAFSVFGMNHGLQEGG